MTMSFRGTVNPMTTTAVDQHVVSVDLPIMWEPNAPEARLTATDHGEARLTLRPHPDDHDQGQVELVWTGCCATRMDATNDEAIGGHQLHEAGLRDVLWLGEVRQSALIAELQRLHPVPPQHSPGSSTHLRHWVAPLKECIVEVVASSLRVERGAGVSKTAAQSWAWTASKGARECHGRRVVDELVGRARRRAIIELLVSTDTPWTSAVALYRACGFAEVGSDERDTHFRMAL